MKKIEVMASLASIVLQLHILPLSASSASASQAATSSLSTGTTMKLNNPIQPIRKAIQAMNANTENKCKTEKTKSLYALHTSQKKILYYYFSTNTTKLTLPLVTCCQKKLYTSGCMSAFLSTGMLLTHKCTNITDTYHTLTNQGQLDYHHVNSLWCCVRATWEKEQGWFLLPIHVTSLKLNSVSVCLCVCVVCVLSEETE